jgi:hypothetical protein
MDAKTRRAAAKKAQLTEATTARVSTETAATLLKLVKAKIQSGCLSIEAAEAGAQANLFNATPAESFRARIEAAHAEALAV